MVERKFSVNSKKYTDEHNNVMDDLLFSYSNALGYIKVVDDCYYVPTDEQGLKLLEHLKDLDLIEEVTDLEQKENKIELRMNLIKDMTAYIFEFGDKEDIDYWFIHGVPSEVTKEKEVLTEYAEYNELWNRVVQTFAEMIESE